MTHRFADITALCLVIGVCGCSSGPGDRAPVQRNAPQVTSRPAPGETASDPDAAVDDMTITGRVSGDFPVATPDECNPLGVPITMFLTDLFGEDVLRDETATPIADSKCSHEQTIAAGADAWATLAYDVVCRGGDDAELCGATETRRCSLDLLVQWAQERSRVVSTREPIFGFVIDMPPQEHAARIALYRRARQEAHILFDEANVALSTGTRNCPHENTELIGKTYVDALELERWLGVLLANEAADGS